MRTPNNIGNTYGTMRLIRTWWKYNGFNVNFNTRTNFIYKSFQHVSIGITSNSSKRLYLSIITFIWLIRNLNFLFVYKLVGKIIDSKPSTNLAIARKSCNKNEEKVESQVYTSGGATNEVKRTTFPSKSTSFTIKSEYLISSKIKK